MGRGYRICTHFQESLCRATFQSHALRGCASSIFTPLKSHPYLPSSPTVFDIAELPADKQSSTACAASRTYAIGLWLSNKEPRPPKKHQLRSSSSLPTTNPPELLRPPRRCFASSLSHLKSCLVATFPRPEYRHHLQLEPPVAQYCGPSTAIVGHLLRQALVLGAHGKTP